MSGSARSPGKAGGQRSQLRTFTGEVSDGREQSGKHDPRDLVPVEERKAQEFRS